MTVAVAMLQSESSVHPNAYRRQQCHIPGRHWQEPTHISRPTRRSKHDRTPKPRGDIGWQQQCHGWEILSRSTRRRHRRRLLRPGFAEQEPAREKEEGSHSPSRQRKKHEEPGERGKEAEQDRKCETDSTNLSTPAASEGREGGKIEMIPTARRDDIHAQRNARTCRLSEGRSAYPV